MYVHLQDVGELSSGQWAVLDAAMSHGEAALQQKDWAGASHWRFRSARLQGAAAEAAAAAAQPGEKRAAAGRYDTAARVTVRVASGSFSGLLIDHMLFVVSSAERARSDEATR